VNPEVQAAKEMLLMATSADEQKMWVQQLSKKVSKKGIGQHQVTSGGDQSSAGYVVYEMCVHLLLLSLLSCYVVPEWSSNTT